MDDELSIDSITNKKIISRIGKMTPREKAHFRIDWRQLTFYQNDTRSLLSRLTSKQSKYNSKKSTSDDVKLTGKNNQCEILDHKQKLTKTIKKRPILNSLDGCFKSGELSAILGPSGAGKSTFLSALFGDKQDNSYGQTKVTWYDNDNAKQQKHLLHNNEQQKQQQQQVTGETKQSLRIAVLPQHDHLLNHLTVYETLVFASKIKNPHLAGDKQFHRQNVRRVAKMLKLTDCFETRCGRLSGGQYKRVSIGQELLSQPDVIILDEPTSGLDAMTCLSTVRTLKSIVTTRRHPISIILTIHQPEMDVFNLFDQIYVIAQGGTAIYEGPPSGVVSTLAQVNLFMPSDTYNPARFIVENAFVLDSDKQQEQQVEHNNTITEQQQQATLGSEITSESSDEDDDESYENNNNTTNSFLRRSLSSLSDALSGKTAELTSSPMRTRESGRRPLLNIGIQTADGKLITSEHLSKSGVTRRMQKEQADRLNLIKRLNEIQKARYYNGTPSPPPQSTPSNMTSHHTVSSNASSSNESLSSSSSWSEARETIDEDERASSGQFSINIMTTTTTTTCDNKHQSSPSTTTTTTMDETTSELTNTHANGTTFSLHNVVGSRKQKLRRQFDKRLSARHNKLNGHEYPIWYHSLLLAHRTWLSIVRDPIFFGIQFTMHTTIPILLALIFGSHQEEGCPQVANFDLIQFAYATNELDFIHSTMRSIRQSIGNIGVIFFEMFVLCFAINCITALVFPLDMYVLLKEYRNGWYSLRAYFFGRTLADLPVPIVLHSMAMTLLCHMTGQPLEWWRFGATIAIVIVASLIAQSIGLTIGALLMQSSQSAVLAAAGIVAPFFALSGFIVRIHTLPVLAQVAASCSYLYHLLNGFILMRYGFGRCPCSSSDFERNESHEIPHNLKTMASMWVGTYSSEYEHQTHQLASNRVNHTNVDPNIDVIDKLTSAFKAANSFGHRVDTCDDVLPYAMLDFNLKDADLVNCCLALVLMLIVSRLITFSAIYYKVRSFS